ncbi:MAG: glutathione S-transferase N-terminal domain-containing protein [Rhodobacteraceae bacterium]|nr:glutathione S-transferase N-terminal domain-containing protein [Paracoccaceae bacterium]
MTKPIDLYFWPTPNGWKIPIALEEMGLEYNMIPVDIGKGDQFTDWFKAVSPNSKMPAIVDHDGPDGAPVSIFESGAILQYLARKTGKFYGRSERERIEIDQWLFWQVGGVGPMAGQAHHFLVYAPEMEPPHDIPYAKDRYRSEVARLYKVLDTQLAGKDYVAGEYSIADMAIWGWVSLWQRQEQDIDNMPNVKAWLVRIKARPAVQAGRALLAKSRPADEKEVIRKSAMFKKPQ